MLTSKIPGTYCVQLELNRLSEELIFLSATESHLMFPTTTFIVSGMSRGIQYSSIFIMRTRLQFIRSTYSPR